jgi:hypothetical protein
MNEYYDEGILGNVPLNSNHVETRSLLIEVGGNIFNEALTMGLDYSVLISVIILQQN